MIEQVGFEEYNSLLDAEPGGVAAGGFEGLWRLVEGVDAGAGQLFSERHGDAAGAGPDVGDVQFGSKRKVGAGEGERRLHDLLGFRTRNQDRGVDEKVEAPEFLVAGDVLRRLAVEALAQIASVVNPLDLGQFALGVGIEMGTVAARGVHQQDFGGEARRRNAAFFEERDGLVEGLFEEHRK